MKLMRIRNTAYRVSKMEMRKEGESEKSRARAEEEEKIELLDFIRECAEQLILKHSDHKQEAKNSQRDMPVRLSGQSRQAVRHDMSRSHLIIRTETRGVCQVCKQRSAVPV
jgi:hypothetical protein